METDDFGEGDATKDKSVKQTPCFTWNQKGGADLHALLGGTKHHVRSPPLLTISSGFWTLGGMCNKIWTCSAHLSGIPWKSSNWCICCLQWLHIIGTKGQKTREGCGCFRGPFGGSRGNFREIPGNKFSRVATCVKFWDFGHRKRQTYREPSVDIALDTVPTFCSGCSCKSTVAALSSLSEKEDQYRGPVWKNCNERVWLVGVATSKALGDRIARCNLTRGIR